MVKLIASLLVITAVGALYVTVEYTDTHIGLALASTVIVTLVPLGLAIGNMYSKRVSGWAYFLRFIGMAYALCLGIFVSYVRFSHDISNPTFRVVGKALLLLIAVVTGGNLIDGIGSLRKKPESMPSPPAA